MQKRGLDFADAVKFFSGIWLEIPDDKFDYGENRFIAYGELDVR